MAYKSGDYLVICDRCGFQRYASKCKMTWDGWFVCEDTCYEEKHPQFNSPKPLGEKQTVPVNRKENAINYVISVNSETLETITEDETPTDGYFISTPITRADL